MTHPSPELRDRLLDRFAEALVTGERCETSDEGPRRIPALHLGGLGLFKKHGLWSDAMRRAIAVGDAHPKARERILNGWMRVPWGRYILPEVGDVDLYLAGLRILLPPYDGEDLTLFRGQGSDQTVGSSWTRLQHIAEKFGRFKTDNVNAPRPNRVKRPSRPDGVLLRAHVPAAAIICAPCLHGDPDGEVAVDPRGLTIDRTARINVRPI